MLQEVVGNCATDETAGTCNGNDLRQVASITERRV